MLTYYAVLMNFFSIPLVLVEGRFDEEVMPADIIVSAKDGIKAHYCYYCPSDVRKTQIHRHLRLMHADEKEMKEVRNEKDSTIGGLKMTLLKLKGDHLHNLEVVRQKRGYLQAARAATNAVADEFVPCAFCKVCKLEVHCVTKVYAVLPVSTVK